MKVLSLFDGMSCGQIALKKNKVKVDNYFASEIKQHAIKCTQQNFPETIQIGDVRKVSFKDGILTTENGNFEVGKIDLLIGGSPCQDLSVLMRNREGLDGKKSVCIVRNYAGSVQSSNKESFIRMCNARSKKGFLTVVYEEKDNPNSVRLFTQTELEKLQTVPKGYTSCLTFEESADLLGDGWTVDVICHILKNMEV